MKSWGIAAKLLVWGLFSCAYAGWGAEPADPVAGVVQRTLPNGLRVLVRPRHTAPVVTTMMWYRVGSRDELPGATGLAHFLEHLLFKGTRKLAKGEIDRITYRNGGSNNAFTFNDYTAYEFNLPSRNWRVALRIEADRMRNCVFDRKEFESERKVVMEERRQSEDDPAQRFSEQLEALAFLAHPYRNPVIGWMEDLRRVTRDEVYDFYQQYYVPANATLVITGDVAPETAIEAARAAFAHVPRLPVPTRRGVIEPPQNGARRLRLTLPTRVPRLEVLFPIPSRRNPDVYALHLLSYVLTEGRLSRLHRRLVERDRLAAEVDSSAGVYRDLGVLDLSADAREGASLEALEAALWEELRRLTAEPVSTRELERARNQFLAEWLNGVATANSLATVIGEADALGGHEYLATLLSRLQNVTPADLQRVARRYLLEERSTTGHLYPAAPSPGAGGQPRSRSAHRRMPALPGRRDRPSEAAPLFHPIRPLERVLPNGLRLVLLENHDLPQVRLLARVDAGSYQETDEQAGLASLTARMLDQGAGTHDYEAIRESLEQVGAASGVSAARESTYVSLTTLSRYAGDLVPLYAEMLTAPTFPVERLEAERGRVLVALQEMNDDATFAARNLFHALVYGSHPGSRPSAGTEATVRRLDRQALAAFHARFYRPENTTVVAVGDFRATEMAERLSAAFGGWSRGSGTPVARPALQRQTDRRERRQVMEKAQTQIVLGHLGIPRSNPDYYALKVLDTILGEGGAGGFTARIPYQLRDVQGLAYGVGSSITASAAKEPGVFVATIGTEPKNEARAVAALLKEVRRIRTEPVTESELLEAGNYLADSSVFGFQTQEQIAAYLQTVLLYGLGYDYRQRFVREVRKVTQADVLRAARRYLDPEHYSLAVVGPPRRPGR